MGFIKRIFSKFSQWIGSSRHRHEYLSSEQVVEYDWTKVHIWLDDLRSPPFENHPWVICRSVNDAIQIITEVEQMNNGMHIALIDMDHDLGQYNACGGDGIKLMDWLLARGTLYPLRFHTANPVGFDNMLRMYKRYWLKENL